jgi:osmoprotectant transport system permease protein
VIPSLVSWFTDPANWSGEDGIPIRVLQHLWYTALTITVAAAVALPMGLWVGHTGRARWLVSLANSLRAVPTLGLLFAVALWLGSRITGDLFFFVPSIVALALLAIPPLLAGTYAGIEAVDPDAQDAAKGLGMTGSQVLRQVEVPNALPLLLSGLRSAVLQVVATATVAAYIGLGGLGRYLIDGIALGDYPRAAGGAVLVAVLAVVLDGLLALAQRRLVSPGLTGGRSGGGGRGKDSRSIEVEGDGPPPDLRTPARTGSSTTEPGPAH